jgi:hypothetical protein
MSNTKEKNLYSIKHSGKHLVASATDLKAVKSHVLATIGFSAKKATAHDMMQVVKQGHKVVEVGDATEPADDSNNE